MQQIFNKVIFTFVSYESDDLLGPGARFSKKTFRARNQIFKSKYKE